MPSPKTPTAHASIREGRRPDFIVVGAMRSGSSSLFRSLSDHPSVYMAPGKELHFFDRNYDLGMEWYQGRFTGAPDQAAVGEATPAYLACPEALQRIASDLPVARCIAVLRDPVDRAYSHYWMRAHRGRERRSWLEVVRDEIDSRSVASVLWHSRYATHLALLEVLVPRERRLILAFDDLKNDPRGTFAAVCRFLEVDAGFVPESVGRHVNQTFRVRSRRVRRWSKRPWVPGLVRSALARVNQVPAVNLPMDPALRLELIEAFAGDRAAMLAAFTPR